MTAAADLPVQLWLGHMVDTDTTPPGAAPTSNMATPPTTTATALGQLAGGAVILAHGMLEKRRERAAKKDAAPSSWVSHMGDDVVKKVRPPNPYYGSPRSGSEATLPTPDPRPAQTAEEFVSKMRQLRAYTDLTLRQISERAGVHGELPKSTLGDVLKKNALPKDTLLRHFLRACGLTDDQAAVWEDTRRRIAMDEVS